MEVSFESFSELVVDTIGMILSVNGRSVTEDVAIKVLEGDITITGYEFNQDDHVGLTFKAQVNREIKILKIKAEVVQVWGETSRLQLLKVDSVK